MLPAGTLPHDKRLGPLKTLDGYFPFTPCDKPAVWAVRAERLRRQLLVANGLWPMPTKTPANAAIYGAVDREQYTVEKVVLQSFPGHYVTGSLYRPKGHSGRLPGVLCPHGHWANGRFHDHGVKEVEKQIADGGEKYEVGGRHPLQARCVQLARMGCVVFHYDMVGYADSQQLPHRPGVREAMNTPENWGYFSPQAEARLQNFMGLQTYNSIRVLDWFSELPDVDPRRIGVTGASGGGTQTFILCAIDPRPAVAFPAVMVSTAMQGGCTCENACYLRVGTGNVEIAALIAPRPLGMTAADDWTKEIATKGLPELQQHYKMLGVPDLVMAKPLLQFGHNYNYPSRAVMYEWFNKHLKLGLKEPIVEEDFRPLSKAEMSVWDAQHPKPAGGEDYERSLLKWITDDSEKQLAAIAPKDDASLAAYRRVVGGAVDVMIGRGLPDGAAIEISKPEESAAGRLDALEVPRALRGRGRGSARRAVAAEDLEQAGRRVDRQAGQAVALRGRRLAQAGRAEAAEGGRGRRGRRSVRPGRVYGRRQAAGQGPPEGQGRGQGLSTSATPTATTIRSSRSAYTTSSRSWPCCGTATARPRRSSLVGLGGAGHWVAAACAQAGSAVDRAAVDTAGFRFAKLTATDDPDFLPGGAKYGDLPGILALSAPMPLWLAGEGIAAPKLLATAYATAGRASDLTLYAGKDAEAAAVEWLLK